MEVSPHVHLGGSFAKKKKKKHLEIFKFFINSF